MFALEFMSQKDIDAHFASQDLIVLEGFSLRTTEMVVIAYHERCDVQLLLQHLVHKLTGCEGGHSSVERQHEYLINSCGSQLQHLLFSRSQQRRRTGWRKDRTGMPVKSNEQRTCPTAQCLILHLADEALMAEVDAIEEADGCYIHYTRCPTISSLSPGSRSITGISIIV